VVRAEDIVLLPPFRADVDVQSAVGGRQLDAILAQVAGDRTVGKVGRGFRRVGYGYGQVGLLRRGHAALLPDIPGHASGIGTRDLRLTDRGAGRHTRHVPYARRVCHRDKCVVNLLLTEEIGLDVLKLRDTDLRERIVGPHTVDRAFGAQHLTNRIRSVIVLPPAALDIAAAD